VDSDILPILIFIGIALSFILIGTYNSFVKLRNKIEECWSGIDVALKRRFNLIPNMIDAVKMYNTHEAEMINKAVHHHNNSSNSADRSIDESTVSKSFQNLLALAEAYPDLKASNNFLSLQQSLNDVEREIQEARNKFNTAVRKNNTLVQSFPSNFMAKIFNFNNAEYFTLELATEKSVPEIK